MIGLLPRIGTKIQQAIELNQSLIQVLPVEDEVTLGMISPSPKPPHWVILSGSFNPLHRGHTQLLEEAERLLMHQDGADRASMRRAFELSFANPDKPAPDLDGFLGRVEKLVTHGDPFFITFPKTPLFFNKMALIPNSTWVLGYDTAVRLMDLKYYGHDAAQLDLGFQSIEALNCRFLIAGRLYQDVFRSATDFIPPPRWSHLFTFLPNFRLDLSSTELRSHL